MVDHREDPEIERLLILAGQGDLEARGRLLSRFRDPLKSLAASRLDRRMASRLDPSDVAQDVLAEAGRRLAIYLRDRPLPFYAWLVQFARDRLIDARRRHLGAANRSVLREAMPPSDSACAAVASDTGPVDRAIRRERQATVRSALDRLSASDRKILLLRHVEGLSVANSAIALCIGEEAVKSRHRRALERLRTLLEPESGGSRP